MKPPGNKVVKTDSFAPQGRKPIQREGSRESYKIIVANRGSNSSDSE